MGHKHRLLAGALVAGALVAGCGGGTSDQATPATTSEARSLDIEDYVDESDTAPAEAETGGGDVDDADTAPAAPETSASDWVDDREDDVLRDVNRNNLDASGGW